MGQTVERNQREHLPWLLNRPGDGRSKFLSLAGASALSFATTVRQLALLKWSLSCQSGTGPAHSRVVSFKDEQNDTAALSRGGLPLCRPLSISPREGDRESCMARSDEQSSKRRELVLQHVRKMLQRMRVRKQKRTRFLSADGRFEAAD
jgi:hypothetical protein